MAIEIAIEAKIRAPMLYTPSFSTKLLRFGVVGDVIDRGRHGDDAVVHRDLDTSGDVDGETSDS